MKAVAAAVFIVVLAFFAVDAAAADVFDGRTGTFVSVPAITETDGVDALPVSVAAVLGYDMRLAPLSGFAVLKRDDDFTALPTAERGTYIYIDDLDKYLNVTVSRKNKTFIWENGDFAIQHGWTQLDGGMIAHACGGNATIIESNSFEMMDYSYSRMFHVFEMDFNTTTDDHLAVVHDWAGYLGAMSSEDWKKVKVFDVLTSMLLEDVFEYMMEHRDMFVVVDSKSFEYTDEDTAKQFDILVKTAEKYDKTLLDRLIPQIYNEKTYDIYMNAYPWKSIIYTLYATRDGEDKITAFVREHPNIRVVTMMPVKCTDTFMAKLSAEGRLVYLHTLNDANEVAFWRGKGVWGFYTDTLGVVE